jgi:hypothetical protein
MGWLSRNGSMFVGGFHALYYTLGLNHFHVYIAYAGGFFLNQLFLICLVSKICGSFLEWVTAQASDTRLFQRSYRF